jgi:predicted HicB family RNase H-like nuclease
MSTMTYKGYSARIDFDERDNIFVGRVLGVRTMISFHGDTVAQLHAEFESAVDDYLADCKDQGLKPEKPASGKLLLRVPPDVHGKAMVAAQAAGKSLNQWAVELMQGALQREARG